MRLNSVNENAPISMEYKEDYEGFNFMDYASDNNPFTSRIPSDKQNEEALKSDYSGRELFEMIQNADDARASVVEIELDENERLHIRNNGGCPFTNKGIRSVMRPHQSSKADALHGGETIGNKGLGIRSLLNWSNGVTIHSNGVKLEFSTSIATARWKEILTIAPSLKELEKDGSCPLPLLSVPVVRADNVTGSNGKGEWTTEIEILCYSEVISDVRSKINDFHAEILLFLKNIRKIILKIDAKTIEISRGISESTQINGIECRRLVLQESGISTQYLLYSEEVSIPIIKNGHVCRTGEIAIGFPIDSDRNYEYLFSYFPTQIVLNLPCAIHANFDLTMSRNGLINNVFNSQLMCEAAKVLMKMAELRSEVVKGLPHISRELPLKMLTLSETLSQSLPEFAAYVEQQFDNCRVIPTINGSFRAFSEGIYYTAHVELGEFVAKIDDDNLLTHYIEAKIYYLLQKNHRTPSSVGLLHNALSVLASRLTIEENAALIIKLLKVPAGEWATRPAVIRLDSSPMASPRMASPDFPVYLLESKDVTEAINSNNCTDTGDYIKRVAPSELKLHIVHPKLSKLLQDKLNTDARGLTVMLRNLATVRDADYSRIKQEIEVKSLRLTIEELNGVLIWLYKRWLRSDSDSDSPLRYKFHLCNSQGNHRPLCSLMLDSDKSEFRLHNLHLGVIPQEDREAFFVDYLGVAEAMPVVDCNFGKDNEYITEVLGSDFVRRVENENNIHNISMIPCANYLRSKSIEEVLSQILSDRRFLKQLSRGQEIRYHYRGEKIGYTPQSYSAYWLTRRDNILSKIPDYVIPHTSTLDLSILNEGILDLTKIAGFSKKEIFELLKYLGAKDNPLELSFSQLYKVLANQKDPAKAQRNYKEIRFVIKDKIDILNCKPDENAKNILRYVWAVRAGEEPQLKPKEEVYYWDNSRLPKRFLNSLYKLMLPSRTGEKSVSEIFGVRLLSDLNIQVLDPEDYNIDVTQDLHSFLFNRLQYLIVMSLSGGEYKLDTIRQKYGDIKAFISQVRFTRSVRYKCQGKEMESVEGDLINDKDNIYICTSASSLEEVIRSPQDCSDIAKGLCLKLKLDVDNEIKFIHVIQSSEETLLYEWNDLDDTQREDILNVMGLNKIEEYIWTILGIKLLKTDINPEIRRKKIISVHPAIKLPDPLPELKDFGDLDYYNLLFSIDEENRKKIGWCFRLDTFYHSQLEAEANRLAIQYKAATFQKLEMTIKNSRSIESVNKWLRKLEYFDQWVSDHIAQMHDIQIVEVERLIDSFRKRVLRQFPILGTISSDYSPTIKPQYSDILERYNVRPSELNYSEQAIGYFDGFEEEFEQLIKGKTLPGSDKSLSVELLMDDCGEISFAPVDEKSGSGGGGNGGFTSSQIKDKIGRTAEIRVRQYLESHPELYESVTDVSTRHALHCDIMYRLKNDPMLRYLEVKSVNGRKIHFSPGEIQKGKANNEIYDLALVYGDNIRIIHNAFAKNSNLLRNLRPSGFEAILEIKE